MDLSAHMNRYSFLFVFFLSVACLLPSTSAANANWYNHGGDLRNRRYAAAEIKISPKTVSNLKLKWEFVAGGDISATPAIFEKIVYFPSWNGFIYAVKATDGSLVWAKNLTELTGLEPTGFVFGLNFTVSRATPTITGDLVLIGIYGPAIVIAVKRATGALVWSTRLDNSNASVLTQSGTVFNRNFFVGTSSLEETVSIEQCCKFRGSMVKLDVRTGIIKWQTYTLPDNFRKLGEYAGAAIWGSSPSIDIKRNLVYVATGNLYSAPQRVIECQERENNQTVPTHPDQCVEPENHENSILAFDMNDGSIKWYRQLGGYDLWFVACNDQSTPGCPPGPNPDADFGEAPMILTVYVNGTKREIVAAVQKSGYAWALDRDNGSVLWSTLAGPGGLGGGGIWGAATEGKRVYTNIANVMQTNFTLAPSTKTTTAGAWVAMEASTGKILWSTANPRNRTASGPVTIANDIIFAGSDDPKGTMYAMDARTGKVLWSFDTGAAVHGGASVSDGCMYVGNGYRGLTPGTSLFSFCIY
ncbi:hypothetical protein ACHQM5_006155 [Ranunculus cassubicifolius]